MFSVVCRKCGSVCLQVIKVDVNGNALKTFPGGVEAPRHVALDSEARVLVADFVNHRVLRLNADDLQLDRYVVDTHDAPVSMWKPTRLCYNDDDQPESGSACLYVVYGAEFSPAAYFVSVFRLCRERELSS